jgi:hypothetical protein
LLGPWGAFCTISIDWQEKSVFQMVPNGPFFWRFAGNVVFSPCPERATNEKAHTTRPENSPGPVPPRTVGGGGTGQNRAAAALLGAVRAGSVKD